VEGVRSRGRPKKTLSKIAEEDYQAQKLYKEDSVECRKWWKLKMCNNYKGRIWVNWCFFWSQFTNIIVIKDHWMGCWEEQIDYGLRKSYIAWISCFPVDQQCKVILKISSKMAVSFEAAVFLLSFYNCKKAPDLWSLDGMVPLGEIITLLLPVYQ